MADPPLHDPFGRSELPPEHDREQRVRMLAEVASALLAGVEPPRRAAQFVGLAMRQWLEEGGDLVRDRLQVSAPRGQRNTAAFVWRAIRDHEAAVNNRDVGPADDG